MAPETVSPFAGGLSLTLLVSVFALVAVWFPFWRALRVALQAFAWTRRVDGPELERGLQQAGGIGRPSLTMHMLQVVRSALRESQGSGHPAAFVVDASKECVTNEYNQRYAGPISMYANVLPPIGFIGTTGGLLILFLSMRVESESLELGALALALTSSIFALMGFATLEALRIRLYGRVLARLDDALAYHKSSVTRARQEAGAAAAASA